MEEGQRDHHRKDPCVTSPETRRATIGVDLLIPQCANTDIRSPAVTWQSPYQIGQVPCPFHFRCSVMGERGSLLRVHLRSSLTYIRHPGLSAVGVLSLVWSQDLGKQCCSAKGTIMFLQTHRSIRIHSMHFTRAIKFYMLLSEIPNTANYPPK